MERESGEREWRGRESERGKRSRVDMAVEEGAGFLSQVSTAGFHVVIIIVGCLRLG